MKRMLIGLLLATFVSSSSSAAEPTKPEVMFMIDTSAHMQRSYNAQNGGYPFAACSPSAAGASNGSHRPSFMNMVQNVLTGAPNLPAGEDSQRCIYDVLETSEAEHSAMTSLYATESSYLRYFLKPSGADIPVSTNRLGHVTAERACCIQSNDSGCAAWRICKRDDETEAFLRDGLIQQYREQYKFGLMTTDADPAKADSFGEDENDPNLNVAQQFLTSPAIAGYYSGLRGIPVPSTPNQGILPMRGNAPDLPAGSLVPPHRGTLIDGRVSDTAIVGELPRQLSAHNAYVIRRIRGLRPTGFSAQPAMLNDYTAYIDKSKRAGMLQDARDGCRKRILFIIAGYRASKTYHSLPCIPNANEEAPGACPPSLNYPHKGIGHYLRQLAQIPNLSVYYIRLGDISDASLQNFNDILAGVGEATKITAESKLRAFISRVLGGLTAGKVSYRAPLVITPQDSDEAEIGIRQYRVTGYTESSAGGRYGRIDVSAFGCPAGGAQDPLGRLRQIPVQSYQVAEKLALQSKLSSIASHPTSTQTIGLNGTVEPSIVSPGQFGAQPNITEEDLRVISGHDAGESLEAAYQMLEAYFGEAVSDTNDDPCRPLCGLPADQTQRQLGAIEYGSFTAITAPRLNLPGDAYQAFELEQRKRPTVFASGASDGKVHFFRMTDGKELFSFVPHAALRDLKRGVVQPGVDALRADGQLVSRNMILCRSLGEGDEECPSNPEVFQVRSLVAGGIGAGAGNLFSIDLTRLTEKLSKDENNLFSVDDVGTWDAVSGFSDPSDGSQAEWDDPDAILRDQN